MHSIHITHSDTHTHRKNTYTQSKSHTQQHMFPSWRLQRYSPQSPLLLQESCLFECQRSITDLTTLSAPCLCLFPLFTFPSPLSQTIDHAAFLQHFSIKYPELYVLRETLTSNFLQDAPKTNSSDYLVKDVNYFSEFGHEIKLLSYHSPP